AFGRIVCTTDPIAAAQRDARMSETASATTMPAVLVPHGARLAAQPMLGAGRFEDAVGGDFAIITPPRLPDQRRPPFVRRLDADTDPALNALLDEHDADVVVVRPDRYVLAAGSVAECHAAFRALLGAPTIPN